MQITVPTNLDSNPLIVTIAGVSYALGAGETLDVPDAIAAELARMLASKTKTPAPVDLPFVDEAVQRTLEDLSTRRASVEAAVAVKELPELPESDGTYGLQLVVDDGEGTLTWEAASV